MGEIAILSREGDTRLMWDPAQADEVAAAKRMYDDLSKKGHLAFKVAKKGDKGEQIRTFDPSVSRIIMVPPMAGG